jgi:PAS domain S-box-containing protein
VGPGQTLFVAAPGDPLSLESAAVVVAGRDGLVSWASPAVLELFGYVPDLLVGRSIEVLVPSEFTARHRAGWKRAWRRHHLPAPTSAVMIPVVCRDGQVRRFASHLVPLNSPHGELLAVAAVWVAPSHADAGLRELT